MKLVLLNRSRKWVLSVREMLRICKLHKLSVSIAYRVGQPPRDLARCASKATIGHEDSHVCSVVRTSLQVTDSSKWIASRSGFCHTCQSNGETCYCREILSIERKRICLCSSCSIIDNSKSTNSNRRTLEAYLKDCISINSKSD